MTTRGELRVVDARDPGERAEWIARWSEWPGREVFAHPAYVALEANEETTRARAALFHVDGATVLYPFLQRRLDNEQQSGAASPHAACDITAPYGYGGAFVWGDVIDRHPTQRGAVAELFWRAFDEWASGEGVVSEFVRFSLFADTLLPYHGEVEERLSNVVRDLSLPLEAIWMDVEHKVRKNVKKAQRSGIEIVHDDGERLDDFLAIYRHTMDRRDALDRYYFPREYFEQLNATLRGQYAYFHALLDGRVVSTELVLVSADRVYSFLGGTSDDAFEHRPNDLLKYAVIEWAKREGKRHFVLGGGYQPGDGIFRYKRAFAPTGEMPFSVGRRILDPDMYARLVAARSATGDAPRAGFFPAYRG